MDKGAADGAAKSSKRERRQKPLPKQKPASKPKPKAAAKMAAEPSKRRKDDGRQGRWLGEDEVAARTKAAERASRRVSARRCVALPSCPTCLPPLALSPLS